MTAWKVSVFRVFLVRIFLHLNLIRGDTAHLSVFSPDAGKNGSGKLRIQTLFMQCNIFKLSCIAWIFLALLLAVRDVHQFFKTKTAPAFYFSRQVFNIALKSNSGNHEQWQWLWKKPKVRQVFKRLKKLVETDPWNYFAGYFTKASSETLLGIIHLSWVQKEETRKKTSLLNLNHGKPIGIEEHYIYGVSTLFNMVQ